MVGNDCITPKLAALFVQRNMIFHHAACSAYLTLTEHNATAFLTVTEQVLTGFIIHNNACLRVNILD